jgi:hypothetical protein
LRPPEGVHTRFDLRLDQVTHRKIYTRRSRFLPRRDFIVPNASMAFVQIP